MATKHRIKIVQSPRVTTFVAGGGRDVPAQVIVDKVKPGKVTLLDKAKAYYKATIAVVGAILVLLNEMTPLSHLLPAAAQHYFTVTVAAVTAISVLLKRNEQWVDAL